MSQCSRVAPNPGGTPTVRDTPLAEEPMGCTHAITLCPPESQGHAL